MSRRGTSTSTSSFTKAQQEKVQKWRTDKSNLTILRKNSKKFKKFKKKFKI